MLQSKKTKSRQSVLVLREHDSVWLPEARPEVIAAAEAIHAGLRQAGYQVIPLQVETPNALLSQLLRFNPSRYVVFNWYEGVEIGAEDGAQITDMLSHLGFTFTGADALTWRTAQDRLRAKRVLISHHIPTPQWRSMSGEDIHGWNHYPAIVKLANEHGSECLTEKSVVHDQASLQRRIADLKEMGYHNLMVSEFIDGREFTVSLWGNGILQALPLLEVDFSTFPPAASHVRSFAAKWETQSEEYQQIKLTPPDDLSPELCDRIKRVARDAFRAFRLRDYGRVDVRLREGVPYVIDVNCNPDITADSSFVAAARQAGYDYSTMLDHIVELAIHRRGEDHE